MHLLLYRITVIKAVRISITYLILAGLSVSSLADQVTPNDRVETRLRIREAPNTDSSILGFLQPRETAELQGDVPYWYEIRLDDGTVGFISKEYARVIPTVASSQILRIGAWNIKKLGHGSSKDFPLVADIIEANFDILGVVEVMQKGGGHAGYDRLIAELGSAWSGLVTSEPRPNTTAGHAEYYAVVYRTARIQPCSGWAELRYHEDNDGSGNDISPDLFSREPAFGCFVASNFDFLLAPYHATWAEGDIEDISEEVQHLSEVFESMEAARPNEADLLIVGDFNLVPTDLEAATGREIPTVGTGSTLNGSGERTQNLYDHMLVNDSDETVELIGAAEVIDVRNEAADNETFFQTVSDHLPIVVRFNTAGADDD